MGVQIEWGTKLERMREISTGVLIETTSSSSSSSSSTEPSRCIADYLVGCDGAHSTVRHLCNLDFPGESFGGHWFLIAHGKLKHFGEEDIWNKDLPIFINEMGVCMVVPFHDETYEIVVDVPLERGKKLGNSMKSPTPEQFEEIMHERIPSKYKLYDTIWTSGFTVHSRQATSYQSGNRVFMCGDACHIHSPVGGQGMNYGMQDAFNLAWKLAAVLSSRALPTLLSSYDQERRRAGQDLVHRTEIQTKGMMNSGAIQNNETLKAAMTTALQAAQKYGLMDMISKGAIAPFLSQVSVSYNKSPLRAEHWELEPPVLNLTRMLHRRQVGLTKFFRARPAMGSRAPNIIVKKSSTPTYIHSLFASGGRFTALLFHPRKGWKDQMRWHGGQDTNLESVAWELEVLSEGLVKCVIIEEDEEEAQEVYGVWGQCLYLIRPDGYLAFRSQPINLRAISAFLSHRIGLNGVRQIMPNEWEEGVNPIEVVEQRVMRLSFLVSFWW
uniref:FAD-binding domain-containing protein n=1 Tax=Paramoeba aestuarina TaxID=180227 RepID=A0A7S4KY53_9EUKA